MKLPTRKQIMKYLRKGSNNTLTAKVIAKHFNTSVGGTEVPIRGVIRKAIEDGELIGSNRSGFFIIKTQEEFDSYLKSLRSRQRKIENRIKNLQKNWSQK